MLIEKLSYYYRYTLDFFYRKHHRLNIMTIEDTLLYINKNKCSVARFGDAELSIILNEDVGFQEFDEALRQDLLAVLSSESKNCLICLPGSWEHPELYTPKFNKYWKKHLIRKRSTYYSFCPKNYRFGDANMTRCYLGVKDKSRCKEYFDLNKKLWDQKDIIIVEGGKSRLGVGNNLFDNCKSIRRILCPARNAYSKKNDIIETVKHFANKNDPVFVALGPTATVLCYELSQDGYFAVDIGNIDKEYEWFLNNSTQKTTNPIKDFIELGDHNVEDCVDPKYLKEIICNIEV